MKSGLQVGDTAIIKAEVTSDMFAQFEGEIVHPAYSTVTMVYHMEWASRKLILPYLTPKEEGMGASVQVKHLAPSGQGEQLEITATVTEIRQHSILSKVIVTNERGTIGEGYVKQAILLKEYISKQLTAK
ncbi:thioesterase [Halobacillus shinanisalinarum]|uniref:Thioesterase n=1 Tax=Halobacillus shinanisalinarum TaxID=2932258 RepID=A0ABY4GW98_9BACI|nr:hotdog domain-containing protein [Halobacillus shinanisalinarum]UOQ92440.1 thioesterase [Halobacillus shinanisalinarum]